MIPKILVQKSRMFLLLMGMAFIFVMPVIAKSDGTPAKQVQEGWQRAKVIGRFHFETTTLQTIHPTSRPENIGRRARTENFALAGDIDQDAHTAELQIWPHGQQLQQSLMIKIENGRAYGRTGEEGEWATVENIPDLFIKDSQPMSYLVAAENVRKINADDDQSLFPSRLLPKNLESAITRYRFELNGLKYAQYMTSMMEDELRRRGELPAGINLGIAEEYVDMSGEGELWLDSRGLPYRQIIHLQFPAKEQDLQWTETRITTNYSDWRPHIFDAAALDWSQPAASLASVLKVAGINPAGSLQTFYILVYSLLILGASVLLFSRYARQTRIVFSLIIIMAMLFGPLLQVQQTSAFFARQSARSEAAQPPVAADETEETFSPQVDPLQATTLEDVQDKLPALDAASTELAPLTPERLAAASDCTITESSDCDNDGLTDKVEIFELGTNPNGVDTDGDGISDNIEVAGFSVGGETWYMNPRDPDSNKDGLPDGLECSSRYNMNSDGSINSNISAGTCKDTDKDGVPDVWDYDNDKDGVPDTVDSDPSTSHSVVDKQFGLTLAGYEKEKPIVVEMTVRPTDDSHLWWTNNYLDWPDIDQAGQIMRVTTETLGTDGDIMLSPILEVTIPYDSSNPSRSLPVKDGVDASAISKSESTDNWLDTDTLDLYAISVSQDTDSGSLVLYAPLHLTKDIVGETPVAWSTQLYYEMASDSTAWGHDHEMRVLWTVNGVIDQCTIPDGETWASYCDVGSERENATNLSHWTTSTTVLQTYYDDFTVTSLAATEEHNLDAAVVAQKAGASGASSYYENYLWHLAETLEEVYLGAQLVSGSRFSVADIGSTYSSWDIPSAALYFQHYTDLESTADFQDRVSGDNTITLLNDIYTGSSKPDNVNLLFVGEKTFRTVGLDEESSVFSTNAPDSFFTLDFSGTDTVTTGFMRWSPYSYSGATWSNTDLETYLETLGSDLQSVFTESQVSGLTGNSGDYTFSDAQTGAVNLAENFYTSLYSGAITLLADGSTAVSTGTLNNSAHSIPSEPVVTVVDDLLFMVKNYYTQISLSNLTLTATLYTELESVATSAWANLATSNGLILAALGQVVNGDQTTTNTVALGQLKYAPYISGNLSDLLNAGALDYTYKSTIGTTETYGLQDLGVAYYTSYRGLYKLYSAYSYFTGAVPKVSRFLTGIVESYEAQLYLGYALQVGTAVASFAYGWGTGKITPGSPEFAQKVAFEISTIIVATVVLVLTIASGGLFLGIMALVSVIDSIAAAICAAAGVKPGSELDQWVCGGLTGALIKAITYIINDYTPLVDLTNSNRLDNDLSAPTITMNSDTPGFAVGNTINITAFITSTLYFGHPNWMGYAYPDQLSDDNLAESTFKYELQTAQADIDLNLNGTSWDFIGGSGSSQGIPTGARYRGNFVAPVNYTVAADEAGVNSGLSVWLAEGFAMNAQDCWLVLVEPVCGLEHYKDTNQTDLSSDLIFDLFPETLDGFHDLTLVDSNSYQQSWDGSFPTLADGDGDGLRSKLAGGDDPDDSTPDTDGDGLGDGFERDNGFDNTEPDGDNDGLTDYWEAFFLTDPYQADSDGDGLLDSEEAFHPNWVYPFENSNLTDKNPPPNAPSQSNYAGGWEIVYEFDGSTPLKSWVSANPNDPDSDDDSINDLREEIYGYNPLAASTLRVLSLDSQVQAVDDSTTHPIPYAKVTSTLNYTADVDNELSDRWALGLLQMEYPEDIVQDTQEMGILQPLESTSLSGSISAGLNASGTTSMTVRAGAIIEGDSDGRVLWLRMNEEPRDIPPSTVVDIVDSSLYEHNADCSYFTNHVNCPTFTGSHFEFSPVDNAQDFLGIDADGWLPPTDFTMAMWVRVDTAGTIYFIFVLDGQTTPDNIFIYSDDYDFKLKARNDVYDTGYNFTQGEWTHVLVTYGNSSSELTAYINGDQIWSNTVADLRAGSDGVQNIGYGLSGTVFAMDEFQIFNRVLDTTEIEQLFGLPVLEVDFVNLEDTSPASNSLSCYAGLTCPEPTSDGVYFNQQSYVDASGSALDFSNDAFTISTWIKPETRTTPFDTKAVDAFNGLEGAAPRTADDNYDWMAVFGAAGSSYPKRAAPSLFVNPAGQMRMFMGDGSSTCHVDTAEGLIQYGTWQHVTVSYDGSIFTFYLNGQKVAESSSACAAITPYDLNQLQIGRGSHMGLLYFDKIYFSDGGDGGGKYELRINYDSDSSSGNIWNKSVDDASQSTDIIDLAYYIRDDNSHWFRMWEDDSSPNNNDFHSCSLGCDDDFGQHYLANTALGSQSHSFDVNDLGSSDYAVGNYDWSVSNDFFQGYMDGFKAYTRAFSDEDALNLFESSYDGLYFNFDEAPGANAFADDYDSNIQGTCDYAGGTCPDSGVGGIANQSAHFQDGVDYLTLSEVDLLQSLNESFTVSAWIKPDQISGRQRILAASRDNSINGFGFGLNNNKLLFTTFGKKDYVSSATVSAGEWSHVAVVFDSSYDASFYVNGEFKDKISGSSASASNSDDPYRIGSTTNSNGSGAINEPFFGKIDDLAVEARELDEVGIQRLMANAPLLNLHFDEDLFTTSFTDDSRLGNNAACSGSACPGAGDKGQIREAAVFDGIDDILIVPESSELALDEFTISLWVNPTEIKGDYQPLIVRESSSGGSRNYGLFIHPDNMDIHMSMSNSGCSAYQAQTVSNNPLAQHQWNHVVFTYADNSGSLYINGTLRSTYTTSTPPCLANNPIKIGGEVDHFENFSGGIDEVTINGRAFSSFEVADLFNYQSAWFDVKETHIIVIDDDTPTVSLDRATPYIAPGETVFKINAHDPTSDIVKVAYGISDYTGEIEATNTNGVWTFSYDFENEGSYNIVLFAWDSVGNVEIVNETLIVDTQAPTGISGSLPPHTPTDGVLIWSNILVEDSASTVNANSGIDSTSVMVTVRDRLGNIIGAPTQATTDIRPGNYVAEIPFPFDPYGEYFFSVSFKDNVGNLGSFVLPVFLEGTGPHADVMLHATTVITAGNTLQGVASDIEHIWQSRTMQLHFEDGSGATSFLDTSANEFLAECPNSAACPAVDLSGEYNDAVSFDGSDDYLVLADNDAVSSNDDITSSLEQRMGLTDSSFTVMAWLNASSMAGFRPLLGTSPFEDDQELYIGFVGGMPLLSYGGHSAGTASTVAAGEWHHVAWRYDMDAREQAIFIDGELVVTQPNRDPYTGSGNTVTIGQADPTQLRFAGLVDELVVYKIPVTDERIYDIANPVQSGLEKIEVRYRHIDDQGNIEDSGTWYEASFDSGNQNNIFRSWNHTVPDGLNGSYKIDLRATDTYGVVGQETASHDGLAAPPPNQRYVYGAWTGVIGDPRHGPIDQFIFMPVIGGRP